MIRAREAGGYGIDAQWSDDFHHALHSVITGERSGYYEDFGTLAHLARAIQDAFVYAGTTSRHRQRVHGRPPHDLPGWRFVVAAQNHDQVGNRATGERLSHLTSAGRVKIAAGNSADVRPFVPMLFQGEEWGASTPFLYFTAHEDHELGALVTEGRRKEFAAFGWDPASVPDPQSEESYHRSKLQWTELTAPHHSELQAWYRAVVALRRSHPTLRDGNYRAVRVTFDEERAHLAIYRGHIVVVCNLGDRPATMAVAGARQVLLASDPGVCLDGDRVDLPGESIVFLSREQDQG